MLPSELIKNVSTHIKIVETPPFALSIFVQGRITADSIQITAKAVRREKRSLKKTIPASTVRTTEPEDFITVESETETRSNIIIPDTSERTTIIAKIAE